MKQRTAFLLSSLTAAGFSPAATAMQEQPAQVEVVATGLEVPMSLAFLPDGRLLVAERPGRVRTLRDGVLQEEPWAVIPEVYHTDEGGLIALAPDPNFSRSRAVYVMFTYQVDNREYNQVARLVDEDGHGVGLETILSGIPGGSNHNGGRLRFGPDGKLYVSTGEIYEFDLAQNRESLAGKILRLNPDGSIPRDNPFADSPVWSYGHRNPQGLVFHPNGLLFSSEHGPSGEPCCHDELNIIQAGQNYGWPEVYGMAGRSEFVDPILESGADDTWAPASLGLYTGTRLPYTDNLFIPCLAGAHLHRVILNPPNFDSVAGEEVLFPDVFGRLREVAQGPDGFIYFTTSNRDGRGDPQPEDDRILRIVAPVAGASFSTTR
jgi:glucose/arabinose dehydrogenase